MYLHLLEKDEKHHFLSLAHHLASIDDNKVDARERYMLNYMCAEMGLDPANTEVLPLDLDRLEKAYYRGEARRALLVEALGVCHANGQVHPRQRALLEKLATKFFLPDDFIAKAEGIIIRQLAVMKDFDELIEVP